MGAQSGTVEAVSNKFDKLSVLVNEVWFSTKQEFADEWKYIPEKGDLIQFDDGGKKFLKKVTKLGSGEVSGGGTGPSKSFKSNTLGVELGHAANLAMTMVLKDMELNLHRSEVTSASEHFAIGSPEFYKTFVEYTEQCKKLMSGLRAKHEAGDSEVTDFAKVTDNKAPVGKVSAPEVTADIF
jgi:hypothetical protein